MSSEIKFIVIDNGSSKIRAGIAGDNTPKVTFDCAVASEGGKDIFGKDALTKKNMVRPVQNSVITNWDAMEKIWQHTFKQLSVDTKECGVLITEPCLNPADNREKVLDIMFKKFNVKSVYLINQGVLALYAVGGNNGIVLDVGTTVTHTLPVKDGQSNYMGIWRIEVGREHISNDLEVLFNPSSIGKDVMGVHKMLKYSIDKCDEELRKSLYGNVVLSGATCKVPGMKERLTKELKAIAPEGTKVEVVGEDTAEVNSWIGGSILAAKNSFQSISVTKKEYEEKGAKIVQEKCK